MMVIFFSKNKDSTNESTRIRILMLQYVILQNSRHPSNKCSSGDPMTAEGAMCLVLDKI